MFSSLTVPHWHALHGLYQRSFPTPERRPASDISAGLARGTYWGAVATDPANMVVGFALLKTLPGVSLHFLEYLAVSQDARGQGIGGALLAYVGAQAQEHLAEAAILFEVEPPVSTCLQDARNRRIRFYENQGAEILGLSHVYKMPNYAAGSGGVALRLMQLPLSQQPDAARLSHIVSEVYRVVYPGWDSLRDEILADLSAADAGAGATVPAPKS